MKKTKTDLSKYLDLSAEDQRALGMIPDPYKQPDVVIGVDLASGPDHTVVRPYGEMCRHANVTLRERTDVKSKRLPNNLLATPHTCLDCGALMWRLHPGPRRLRERREDEA